MDAKLLWDLFRETGDPLGYLLYAANARDLPRSAGKSGAPPEEGRLDAPPGPPAAE